MDKSDPFGSGSPSADTAVEPFPPRVAVRITVQHYFHG